MEPSVPTDFGVTRLLDFAFNKELISNFTAFPNPAIMKSGVIQATLKADGYRLNFSYGLLPEPPTVKKMDKPQVILDIDLISENQFNVEVENVISEWRKVNKKTYNLFSWAISDQLKVSLDE